jgi:predicted Rossmann fold flavoprotein
MREGMKGYDVIVIGGGASGMMAAGRAAECGRSVLLLEKNAAVGKKLDITGGGRCNVTNAEFDKHAFAKRYGAAEHFLYSPLSQFGVESAFDFFKSLNLPLVVEARKRAFPGSQKASDVTRALKKYMGRHGVEVRTSTPVRELRAESGRITHAVTARGTFAAQNFIIATGSLSHPETGSTGDGFTWLAALGHSVHSPTPAIVPLKVREAWLKKLAGVSLPRMKITFFSGGKYAFSKTGPLIFTHFGLSGPTILNSAGAVGELLKGGDVAATIDLHPDTDFAAIERRIIDAIDANKNKDFKNLLDDIAPRGTAGAILQLLHPPDPKIKSHSVTKEDRKRLVHILKAVPVTVSGLMGFDRAVVSDGGVPLGEVDTRTMRSRIISNLCLTGDVLHIRRPSGGYSLQLCWTTGYVAGSNA